MATPRESNDGDDDEETALEKEINELRLVKKTLFEEAKPINEKLEKVALRERECVKRQQQLRAEKHDRDIEKQAVRRLSELESEIKRLKCANIACSDMNKKLKQSLDQATKHSRAQAQKIDELAKLSAEQQLRLQKTQAASDTAANSIMRDLERQLSKTQELLSNSEAELSETRERLSKVQDALTAAEQLTAATQQRELQEEKLQLELIPQHQLTRHSGISWRLILLLFYFVTSFSEA